MATDWAPSWADGEAVDAVMMNARVKGYMDQLYDLASVPPQPTWTPLTLQAGWSSFPDGRYTPPAWTYYRGQVYLRGNISGGTYTDGTVIFTLPSTARPASLVTLPVFNLGGSPIIPRGARLSAFTDGTVQINNAAGNYFLSMDGSSYFPV